MATDQKSIPEVVSELWQMSVSYAKQETVEPLKGVGRYVAFGVGGSLLLAIGVLELTLAGLRALQTQTDDRLTGNLSWIPYLAAFVLLIALSGLAVWRITAPNKKGDR